MSDIFLSYAREDRAVAEAVATALEAHGRSVWWDLDIPAGRTFRDVIETELDAARCVLVLWSSTSISRRFVIAEAEEGARRQILVPALIESVRQPIDFRGIHAADLVGWRLTPSEPQFASLVTAIDDLLRRDDEISRASKSSLGARSSPPELRRDSRPVLAADRPGSTQGEVIPSSAYAAGRLFGTLLRHSGLVRDALVSVVAPFVIMYTPLFIAALFNWEMASKLNFNNSGHNLYNATAAGPFSDEHLLANVFILELFSAGLCGLLVASLAGATRMRAVVRAVAAMAAIVACVQVSAHWLTPTLWWAVLVIGARYFGVRLGGLLVHELRTAITSKEEA